MKLKVKIIKKFISILCAMSISTSFAITSASAIDTTDAEAAFSMQYINSLPKSGEENFDKFSGAYERGEMKEKKYTDTLQANREYDVNYPGKESKCTKEDILGEEKEVYSSYCVDKEIINEKEVYNQIKQQVEALKRKVKEKAPNKCKYLFYSILGIKNNKISKHQDMPEKMRIAKAIYRWIAKNIPYDYDSLAYGKDTNTGEKKSLRKPQDPLYVFAKKTGVCAGKANLLNLMMRLAGIPSVVIASRTHAFNAVYLKDKTTDRQGWVLLDPTWGATESDMSLQTGVKANNYGANTKKEKIDRMIQGTVDLEYDFMKDNFAMDDRYSHNVTSWLIDVSLNIYNKNVSDNDIEKLNKDLEENLKKLNNDISGENGFKLNKIKIIKDEKTGNFLIEYETNIAQDKAEEFHKNVQERFIKNKAKEILEMSEKNLFGSFGKLNEEFTDRINYINELNDRNTLKKSKEYCNKFQKFCEDLFRKNEQILNGSNRIQKNNAETLVNDMNEKIKYKIEELGQQYQGIVKIKDFKIVLPKLPWFKASNLLVNMSVDLKLEDAIKILEKQSNWSKIKEFFSGFYDKTLAFKYANEIIIDQQAHKIEEMVFGHWHDDIEKNLVFDRKTDGITYKMSGPEGDKTLELIGDEQKPLENVKVSPDMANLKVPLKIGKGIKSLALQGDDSIGDFNLSYDSQLVNVSNSNKYVADEVALFEKDTTKLNGKGKLVSIFKHEGQFGDGIKFEIETKKDKDGQIEVNKIKIFDSDSKHDNVKLPKFLTQFNVPIKVDRGIKSLILENNDIVDLSKAKDLEHVFIDHSNKYMIENNMLYETNNNGKRGNKVYVPYRTEIRDKIDEEKIKNECQKMLQEFTNKHTAFVTWKESNKIADKDDTIIHTIQIKANLNANDLKELSDINKHFNITYTKVSIDSAKETMDMMDKFMRKYEEQKSQKEINNDNIAG